MKRRKIRIKTGDVFVAPLNRVKAKYSDEWNYLWEPEISENCFIMQIIGMSRSDEILMILYDGIYPYNSELENIDAASLNPVAIATISSWSMRVGAYKKASNQLVPESTPYMIYGVSHRGNFYIEYNTESGRHLKKVSNDLEQFIPRYGLHLGDMNRVADYFLQGIKDEFLYDDDIDRVKIRKEAFISNFFPEAKDNPNICMKFHFEGEAILQDRDSYE